MTTELVRMERMSKTYGRVEAIRNIDLTVNAGEIVGLVGDNGAGKSTLIKILVGEPSRRTPEAGYSSRAAR